MGEIMLEEYEISERHSEKTGVRYKRDRDPFTTAKGALKAARKHYLDRRQHELQQEYSKAEEQSERKRIMNNMREASQQRTMLLKLSLDELFPDPDGSEDGNSEHKVSEDVFHYKMKGE
jgi:DNA primase